MTNRSATICLEENDAVSALWLTASRRSRIPVQAVVIGGPLAAVAVLIYGATGWMGTVLTVLAWIVLTLSALVAIAWYWIMPRQAQRHFSQTALLRAPMELEWDEQGFALSGSQAQSRLGWQQLHGWLEGDRHFVLMHSEMLYNIVPHRSLSPDQVSDLRDCLAGSELKKR